MKVPSTLSAAFCVLAPALIDQSVICLLDIQKLLLIPFHVWMVPVGVKSIKSVKEVQQPPQHQQGHASSMSADKGSHTSKQVFDKLA